MLALHKPAWGTAKLGALGVGRKSLVQGLLWLLLTQDRARAAFPLC